MAVLTLRPAELERHVLPFLITALSKALANCGYLLDPFSSRTGIEETDHWHRRLLRPRRERPRRRTAEQRDEGAPFHSITSSARASSLSNAS